MDILLIIIPIFLVLVLISGGLQHWFNDADKHKAKKAEMEAIKKGLWEFPAQEFYLRCTTEKVGLKKIGSDFEVQKATIIAKEILSAHKVPETQRSHHLTPEKIKANFEEGRKLKYNQDLQEKKEREKEKKEREKERRIPKRGHLSEAESHAYNLARKVLPVYGIEKRELMLQDAIQQVDKQIQKCEAQKQALKDVALLMVSSSQEKKKDWGTLGGIAEGIAGPGAGAAVAANAIAENRAIEQRNKIARQEAVQSVRGFYDASYKISDDIDALEKDKRNLWDYLNSARYKVVMEQYTTEEIFKALDIAAKVSKTSGEKGLKLEVNIKNCFNAGVPSDFRVAVDGTIDADIYYGDTRIDTVHIPLPMFGVAENESEVATGYSLSYVEARVRYRVEFKPNKLWIVEQ